MAKRIVLVGKAASGKDYLKRYFERRGLLGCVMDTTRPRRKTESDGTDYNFLGKYEFLDNKKRGRYLECGYYNKWYYGTPMVEWRSKRVFIMTPAAVNGLSDEHRKSCVVIYLDMPDNLIKSRLEGRGDTDSVSRRMLGDKKDFGEFQDYDLRLTNPKYNPKRVLRYSVEPTFSKWLRLMIRDRLNIVG